MYAYMNDIPICKHASMFSEGSAKLSLEKFQKVLDEQMNNWNQWMPREGEA